MRVTGERRIAVARERAWHALRDLRVLRDSIPGCEALERRGDGSFTASVSVRIGTLAARLQGTLALADLEPGRTWRLTGEGSGPAGFARGEATIRLLDDGEQTLVAYDIDAAVGGRLAQIGARMIAAVTEAKIDAFFERFAAIVAADTLPAVAAADLPPPAVIAGRPGLKPGAWVPLLIAFVVFVTWLATRL